MEIGPVVYGTCEQDFKPYLVILTVIASAMVLASGVDHCRCNDEEFRVPK